MIFKMNNNQQTDRPRVQSLSETLWAVIRTPYDYPMHFFIGALAITAGVIKNMSETNITNEFSPTMPVTTLTESPVLLHQNCPWVVNGMSAQDAVKQYRRIPPYRKTPNDKSCENLAKAKADRERWDMRQKIIPLERSIKVLNKLISKSPDNTQSVKEWQEKIVQLTQEINLIKNPPAPEKKWYRLGF
jgi:hypothetical protein